MSETRWWRYLNELMGDETATEAARRSGISSSNFTRWKKGARADPDFVVKVARAYNANVLEALVEAEFITEEEAALTEVQVGGIPLEDATEDQLADEVLKRMKLGKASGVLDMPVDELAARRGYHFDPTEAVASSAPEEPGPGDDDYHDGP